MGILKRLSNRNKRRRDYARYERTLAEYVKQCGDEEQFCYREEDKFPIINEYSAEAGNVDGHYFYQDIYVAQKVNAKGYKHIHDIGSRIDGYLSHLLAMGIKVTMIDVRPLAAKIENLDFVQGNAMELGTIPDNSLEVLSSLHAIEHFGLGRYGDPVDYKGWEKALNRMKNKIKPGGELYLSTPIGREEKLMFNAHRIFAPTTIAEVLNDGMECETFAYIHDGVVTEYDCTQGDIGLETMKNVQLNSLGEFDLGIFIYKKL